ncbi:hypothetical protein M409DRAFT_18544 [Zasmidium cellare ATCC 36951]|uniref:Beta-lactamase-related domain-containing protein n=1 Tax=Zasmidium cellare ATCC 36951 TaxID=1080233 RepID=A0A6A6CW56_ZASCE|nr:uncharacterized protein M409DRAFT_18544 [Zasmidium cellare ATCC 36951]KAF2171427.1 hypothetical protein M409DRAFT_18544 [Zasmidium cellare ATCC 36951]
MERCRVKYLLTEPSQYEGTIILNLPQGYGFSELPSTLATPDTLYFAGSTTKAFTAAAAGKLIHQDQSKKPTNLKWTTPISQILKDDFILSDEYATSHVTIEDALSHRSGLPLFDNVYGCGDASALDTVRLMRHLPFSADIRTKWQYNNFMYAAVQTLVERLSDQSLENFLAEEFWKPLDMASTMFDVRKAQSMKDDNGSSRLTRGYFWNDEGGHYVPDEYLDLTPVAGAGAMISSVNDMALWTKALLQASQDLTKSSSPINHHLFRDITTPRCIIPDAYSAMWKHSTGVSVYALGWFVQSIGRLTLLSHGGGLCGFGTTLYLVPECGLGFVAMGNTMGASNCVETDLFFEVLKRLGIFEPEVGVTQDSKGAFATQGAEQTNHDQVADPVQLTTDTSLWAPENYTGVYSHPGLGDFTVTMATTQVRERTRHGISAQGSTTPITKDTPILLVEPSRRTWPYTYVLVHQSGEDFTMAVFFRRGNEERDTEPASRDSTCSRKLECKNGLVMEFLYSAKARLEGSGERLGMQLSPELADCEAAEEDWRKGMIWLEKR